jgi:GAF domain-containing protein
MTTFDKHEAYQQAVGEINAILEGETNMILKMTTINCVLRQHLPYYYWVGFYAVNKGKLIVGPYQGTLGCLHISFSQGICGRAARLEATQVVANVHNDSAHIACDSRTNSEIVLPVWDNEGQLIAVLDIDSTDFASFDNIDQSYLEPLLDLHFKNKELIKVYE